jgi:hypothetical protein
MVTFETNEGDLTIATGFVWHDGAEDLNGSFVNPIAAGALVAIRSDRDWTVEQVALDTQVIVGIAFKNAQPQRGTVIIPTTPGVHSDIYRQVSVEIWGDYIRTVVMGTGAAVRGNSIKHDATTLNTWIATGSFSNHTYVLRIPTGFATALFGHRGTL